jgi:hypothetical protein
MEKQKIINALKIMIRNLESDCRNEVVHCQFTYNNVLILAPANNIRLQFFKGDDNAF